MNKNEYRRALIMLRSVLAGYSGHARMEVRTLMGSISVLAQAPQGTQSLRAALVGTQGTAYYAYPLGAMRKDARGQWTITTTIDPRDIGGRELDAYRVIAISTINDGECETALVGNICGGNEIDWIKLRDTVCALYAPQPRAEAETQADSTASETTEVVEEEVIQEPILIFGESNEETAITDNALEWDLTETASDNTDIGSPFNIEGWSTARASLPSQCGFDYIYIGESPDRNEICLAVPAPYAAEPPAGMEAYEWSGGVGGGYWIACFDATVIE